MYRGWTQTDYQNKHYNINQKDEGTWDDRGRDGGTNFILRIKEQETRLTLQEHDDDDNDDDDDDENVTHHKKSRTSRLILHGCKIFQFEFWEKKGDRGRCLNRTSDKSYIIASFNVCTLRVQSLG